jgi:hypothetical protein
VNTGGLVTFGSGCKLYNITNTNVDDAEEALVLLLELLLVEDLDRKDAVFTDMTAGGSASAGTVPGLARARGMG